MPYCLAHADPPVLVTGPAPTGIYTLSLHDALPIYLDPTRVPATFSRLIVEDYLRGELGRSEEHTSELQSHSDLVCRLLLEKKKFSCYNPGSKVRCDAVFGAVRQRARGRRRSIRSVY